MKTLARDGTRWAVSGGAAALVVGAFALMFTRTGLTVDRRPPLHPKPPIALGPARSEELAMRDLTPLFLPTPLNAPAKPVTPPEPGRAFFDHDPGQHTVFTEENPRLELPPTVTLPKSAADAVAMPPPPLAAGIGRKDAPLPAFPPAAARVDVYAAGGGPSLIGVPLPPDAGPLESDQSVPWQPLEFAAAVDAAGLVDTLVLTHGSGNEEVDAHFRNYLATRFRLGDRLPPGFYRVVVAP